MAGRAPKKNRVDRARQTGERSYTMWRMILDRRSFLSAVPALLGPAAVSGAEAERKTRFYVMDQYQLEQGPQTARIHDFFSKTLLPALGRIHGGPTIVLEAIAAPHMPLVTLIFGVERSSQIWEISQQLFADREFSRGFDEWEAGAEPFVTSSATLLEATVYSPEIVPLAKPPEAPRIFELRTYQSPTARQRKALDARFSGAEIKIFQRVGVHPVFYSSTVFGANRPNLTYLIPFDNLAAREKAWNAFSADEEWVRVRKESVERDGQITAVIDLSLHRAMSYSPVR
jgi:hypothetical protein